MTEAPTKIQRLLASCLEKDPRKRLRDIGDWQRLLEPIPGTALPRSKRGSILPWVITAGAILAAIVLGAVAWNHFTEQPQVLRLTLQTPEKIRMVIAAPPPSLRSLLMVATRPFAAEIDGKSGLWLRDLDGPGIRLLADAEGADSWFWSPDSQLDRVFADDKLEKIDVTGGTPLILCDANGVGGAWSRPEEMKNAMRCCWLCCQQLWYYLC